MKRPTDSSRIIAILFAAVILVAVLWTLRQIVILVGFSMLLAYALDPLASMLERVPLTRTRRVPRGVAAGSVVLLVAAIAALALAIGIPRLVSELRGFMAGAPDALTTLVLQARAAAEANGWLPTVGPMLDSLQNSGGDLINDFAHNLGSRFGAVLGGLGHSLEFALMPLLAFYLLAERNAVESSVLSFVPAAAHERAYTLSVAIDRALRSYVRGQAVVVLIMGILVTLVLTALGIHLSLLLGVLAGLGELVPYIGFTIAAVSIALAGIPQGPEHAAIGLAGYILVNWTVGSFITPRVMGRHLKMHPFVVTVSVLAGVELLGPPGAMLALPAAAVMQSLVAELAPRRPGGAA